MSAQETACPAQTARAAMPAAAGCTMLTKSDQLVNCLPTYSRRMPDLHAHGAVLEVQGRRWVNSTAKILYQLAHCNGHVVPGVPIEAGADATGTLV